MTSTAPDGETMGRRRLWLVTAGLLLVAVVGLAALTAQTGEGGVSAQGLVAGLDAGPAGSVLTPTPCVPPANDDSADAEVIDSIPFSISVDTTCATLGPSDGTFCAPVGGTVWYRLTASSYQLLGATVTGGGKASLGIYSIGIHNCDSASDGEASLKVYTYPGTDYYFQVSGEPGGKMSFTLDVPPPTPTPTECPASKVPVDYYGGCGTPTATPTPCIPPANDDFEDAQPIGSPYSTVVTPLCATTENGELTSCGAKGTLWYSFTPSTTEVLQVSLGGYDHNYTLAIFTGQSLADLDELGCDYHYHDDDGQPNGFSTILRFKAVPGTTYFIQLGRATGYEESVKFQVGSIPTPTPTITRTFTPTPCPAGQVPHWDNTCATRTPTRTATFTPTPCPTEKARLKPWWYPYQEGCGTPTPTTTPCTAPANDDLEDAIEIGGLPYAFEGSASCGTGEPNEPFCGADETVWLKYTPETPTRLRATFSGEQIYASVFTKGTKEACRYVSGPTEIIFDALAYNTYFLGIATWSGFDGRFTFGLEVGPPATSTPTRTPTATPCPAEKVYFYDYSSYPYQVRCGTPTPSATPCPTEKVYFYESAYPFARCGTPTPSATPCPTDKVYFYKDSFPYGLGCGTPTATSTPCPSGKIIFYDQYFYPDQLRCGTPTPTLTPCPIEKVYFYDYPGYSCGTPTPSATPCPAGKVLYYSYDYPSGYNCGTATPTPTPTITPTPCPTEKIHFFDYNPPYGIRCGTATPTFSPTPTCPAGQNRTFFGCVTHTPSLTPTYTSTPCPTEKVLFFDYESYPYQLSCGTPTPTNTPCPAGKVKTFDGCGTATPTLTPCPDGKVKTFDGCGSPTPTRTPCPTGTVPSANGCHTPVPTQSPSAGLDFSIGVDTSRDGVDDCGTRPGQLTTCYLKPDEQFALRFYLNALPFSVPGYEGIDVVTSYSGVTSPENLDLHAWPDCQFQATALVQDRFALGCAIGIAAAPSSYTGLIGSANLTCTNNGLIHLRNEQPGTAIVDSQLHNHYEGGVDKLVMNCGSPAIASTPTPPKTGDPRGPSMALEVFRDEAKAERACGKGAFNRSCTVVANETFGVDVKTDAGPENGFQGYQIVLQYGGDIAVVQQAALTENDWPGCNYGFEQETDPSTGAPGRYVIGCDSGSPATAYSGVLSNIRFACTGAGTGFVSILGGPGARVSFYNRPSIYGNRIFLAGDARAGQVLADSVLIQCGEYAGIGAGADTDGDGCADAREGGSNELLGGRRDPLNPWDFFDATGDSKHRLDDVLAVMARYFADDGEANYWEGADRSSFGDAYWELGAPNGEVRMDDILAAIRLYFHDCT
jgi:hypothetical protein